MNYYTSSDNNKKQFSYLYYKALSSNTFKHNSNLHPIPLSCFSNYLIESENEYQKLSITLWAVKKKTEEYEVNNTRYSICELESIVNKVFFKNNLEVVSIYTLCSYIKTLLNLKILVKSSIKSFIYFEFNKENWDLRYSILKDYIETKVETFLEDKKIVGSLPEYKALFLKNYEEALKEGQYESSI